MSTAIAHDRLKSFVERIETLEDEKAEIAEQIKQVYAEAKGEGYDIKIMREVIRRRRMQAHDRRERDELLDLYEHALGMTPLERAIGEAA